MGIRMEGELNMIRSVIERAIWDCYSTNRNIKRAAKRWLNGKGIEKFLEFFHLDTDIAEIIRDRHLESVHAQTMLSRRMK